MPDQINLSAWEAIRWASIIANGVLLFIWLKSKTLLDDYLNGRWEGSLVKGEDGNFVISCVLCITKHKNSVAGYIQYESREGGMPVAAGMDRYLHCYDKELMPENWNPKFESMYHVDMVKKSLVEGKDPTSMKFTVTNRWFRDTMNVQAEDKAGALYAGKFTKK